MTSSERLLQSILKHGISATIKEFSGGTQCPCMISRGSEAPAYSAEWHRQNPTATHCNGTGEIGATESTTTIKTQPMDASLISDALKSGLERAEIGRLEENDIALYGAVDEDGDNYSFDGLADKNEITMLGHTYCVKTVLLVPLDASTTLTAAVCRRLE